MEDFAITRRGPEDGVRRVEQMPERHPERLGHLAVGRREPRERGAQVEHERGQRHADDPAGGAESGRGFITDYRILAGNPADENHVAPSLRQHAATLGRAPALYAADRGFHTAANVEAVTAEGVRTECLPQRGGAKTAA